MQIPDWRGLVAAVWLGATVARAAGAETAGTAERPVDYFLVVTGGELLEGVYPDAHTPFLTRTLRPLGCRCVGSLLVDDDRAAMLEALRHATNRAALVIVTGGLGPTPNDITRDVLAEFTGQPLREDPQLLAALATRMKQPVDQLRPNVRRQARVPQRGGFLKNANGTAAGLVFDLVAGGAATNGPLVIALPGPPRELQPMVRDELVPLLQRRCGVRPFGHVLTLRFVGLGQSQIDQTIKDHVALAPDVIVTSLFEGSRVDFSFALPGHTPEDLARLRRLEAAILEHLGAAMYADDGSTLEEVVARRLAGLGRIGVVEVGSGGQLAVALRGTTGSAAWLGAAGAAGSEEGLAESLGLAREATGGKAEARISALAGAAARWAHCGWGLAVGSVETAEAGGGRGVWMALQGPDEPARTRWVKLPESGEINRPQLVTALLDELRRFVPAR